MLGDIRKIKTGNKNLMIDLVHQLPKPNPQPPGQIVNIPVLMRGYGRKKKRRMRGRGPIFTDKYGTFLRLS